MAKMKFTKLTKSGIFKVNDYTKIHNFKTDDSKLIYMKVYGEKQPYLKFKGKVGDKSVIGFINIKNENIYGMKYKD